VFKRTTYDEVKKLYYNFMLDSVSPARGLANPAIIYKPEYLQYHLEKDLNGNYRMTDGYPDAGAYEWQPTK
jgi:hypothetical protein